MWTDGLAAGVQEDPPGAVRRAFPAGIAGVSVLLPTATPIQSWHGNGGDGHHLHAPRDVTSAIYLHVALSPADTESFTMRCRKKLFDALSVRNKPR
jgi:hypothetical protein